MKITYIKDWEEWTADFSFSASVAVRFSETDMFGHLNNTVPFTYFEYARIEYFKQLGLMADWLNPTTGKIPVVADLQCDFLKQVFFDEELAIHVKTALAGTSSVDIHYMAKNEKDEIVFVGRGTIVLIGRQSGKGIPWTEEERSFFVK